MVPRQISEICRSASPSLFRFINYFSIARVLFVRETQREYVPERLPHLGDADVVRQTGIAPLGAREAEYVRLLVGVQVHARGERPHRLTVPLVVDQPPERHTRHHYRPGLRGGAVHLLLDRLGDGDLVRLHGARGGAVVVELEFTERVIVLHLAVPQHAPVLDIDGELIGRNADILIEGQARTGGRDVVRRILVSQVGRGLTTGKRCRKRGAGDLDTHGSSPRKGDESITFAIEKRAAREFHRQPNALLGSRAERGLPSNASFLLRLLVRQA